jgi:hypothetical protein
MPEDIKRYLIRLTNLAYENKEPVTGWEIGVLGAIAKAFSK